MAQHDLTELTDDALHELRVSVTRETDRRDTLTTMPGNVTNWAVFFLRAGGDPQILHDAITAATTEGA